MVSELGYLPAITLGCIACLPFCLCYQSAAILLASALPDLQSALCASLLPVHSLHALEIAWAAAWPNPNFVTVFHLLSKLPKPRPAPFLDVIQECAMYFWEAWDCNLYAGWVWGYILSLYAAWVYLLLSIYILKLFVHLVGTRIKKPRSSWDLCKNKMCETIICFVSCDPYFVKCESCDSCCESCNPCFEALKHPRLVILVNLMVFGRPRLVIYVNFVSIWYIGYKPSRKIV